MHHFRPPFRSHRRVVKAEPLDACSGLALLPGDLRGAIVVATRGACGFGDKALHAQRAGASAVVIVDRPGSALLRIGATHGQVGPLGCRDARACAITRPALCFHPLYR